MKDIIGSTEIQKQIKSQYCINVKFNEIDNCG